MTVLPYTYKESIQSCKGKQFRFKFFGFIFNICTIDAFVLDFFLVLCYLYAWKQQKQSVSSLCIILFKVSAFNHVVMPTDVNLDQALQTFK